MSEDPYEARGMNCPALSIVFALSQGPEAQGRTRA